MTTEPLGGRLNLFCGNTEGGLGQLIFLEVILFMRTNIEQNYSFSIIFKLLIEKNINNFV